MVLPSINSVQMNTSTSFFCLFTDMCHHMETQVVVVMSKCEKFMEFEYICKVMNSSCVICTEGSLSAASRPPTPPRTLCGSVLWLHSKWEVMLLHRGVTSDARQYFLTAHLNVCTPYPGGVELFSISSRRSPQLSETCEGKTLLAWGVSTKVSRLVVSGRSVWVGTRVGDIYLLTGAYVRKDIPDIIIALRDKTELSP